MRISKHSALSLTLGLLILFSLLLVESKINLRVKDSKPDLERLVSLHPPGWKVVEGQQVKFLWEESVLSEYDVVASRRYQRADGRQVLVIMTWSGDGFRRQGHNQQVCYIASGYEVAPPQPVSISISAGSIDAMAFSASRAAMEEDVVFWRVTDGLRERGIDSRRTLVHRLQRLLYLPDLFRGELPDNLMVRVSSVRLTNNQPTSAHIDYIREWLRAISPDDRALIMGR